MGIDELVDALNYFSSSSSWRKTDLESAHRLGFTRRQNRRRNYDHQESPRPLIVTFCHVDDKVLILPDRDLREHGIGLSTDLTPRQLEPLEHLRQQGGGALL